MVKPIVVMPERILLLQVELDQAASSPVNLGYLRAHARGANMLDLDLAVEGPFRKKLASQFKGLAYGKLLVANNAEATVAQVLDLARDPGIPGIQRSCTQGSFLTDSNTFFCP
jgi:hypothetical protein